MDFRVPMTMTRGNPKTTDEPVTPSALHTTVTHVHAFGSIHDTFKLLVLPNERKDILTNERIIASQKNLRVLRECSILVDTIPTDARTRE